MPTLAELYGNPLLDAANTTGRVARTRKPQEEDEQQEIADPAPMPEINKGIISRTGEAALSGLAMVGNFLDLPGSSVRDVLNLKNPFDQYMTPLSDKNRTSGRDLLRSYGLAGKEDDWSNFGTGIGAEMLLDPLTYTGIGLATRGAGQAAKKAGLTKNVTAKTNQAAKKAAEKAGTKAEKLGWMQARMRATPSVLINEADDPAKAMSDFMKYGGTTDMLDKPVNTLLSFNIPWAQWIPGLRDTKLGKTKEIVSKNALKYPDDLPKIADDTAGGPPPQSPPQAPPPGPVAPQGPVAPVAPIAPVAPLVPVAPVAQAIPPAAPQAIPPAAPPVAPQATIPPQPPVAPPAAPKRGRPKNQPVDPTTYAFDADELIQATKLPKDDEAYEFVSGVVQDAADRFGGTLTLKQAREYIDYARANEGLADDQALALEDVLLRAQEFVPTKKNLKKVGKAAAQADQLPGQQAVAPLAPPAAPIAATDNVSVPPAAPNVTDNVSVTPPAAPSTSIVPEGILDQSSESSAAEIARRMEMAKSLSVPYESPTAKASLRLDAPSGTMEVQDFSKTEGAPKGAGKAALREIANNAKEQGASKITGNFSTHAALGALGSEFGRENIRFASKATGEILDIDFAEAMKDPAKYIATVDIDPPAVPASVVDDGAQASAQATPRLDIDASGQAFEPTQALPGTQEKLDVMAKRQEAGLPLNHPGDATDLPPGAAMAAMNPNPLDNLATKEVFQPVVTDGKLNAPATSINFEAISPKHAIYNQNVLTPLLKAKVLNDGNIAWLQTILAKSDMRNISDDLIGQELTGSRAKAIGIDNVNTVPGAYSNVVKSVFVRKKTDLVHSQPEVLLHETGHAIFRELEKTDPDLYSAAYNAIEEAITSGSEGATLFKYFKMAGKNNEYFTSSPGEAFAQLFANVSAGKVNPDSLPSYLLDAVKKVWQKVMDYARRVIGASEAMDPRLKTIEQLVDYAGGYIPKSERDDVLRALTTKNDIKLSQAPDVQLLKAPSPTLKDRMAQGTEAAKSLAATVGKWVSELPEGIADPISKAIDGGLNVVAAIPGVRKALGLLDYSTMGTITEGGQTQAKLVTEAMETARANTREAITPLVRTVEASGHFDPEVIAKETSQSIELATEQANRRAMEFRAFVEGIDSAFFNEAEMPQEVHDIAIAVRKMYEDALELEAQKAGIDVAELRDAYAMYTPRSVRQPGKSYSRNPLSGPQWETTFPGQRSRKDFLKNLPAGTMVIDELSLDPTFSGIVNTAPVIAKNLRRTKTFVENVDVDTIAKLRADMHAKYGPKLIPEYFERMSKLMPPTESTSALDDALAASPRKDWTEAWQEAQEQMALEAEELGKKSEELRKAAKAIKDTDAEKYAELTAQADSLRDSAEELVFNPGKDKRYDAMINFIAGLDPTYVKENSPVFGRNLLHDTMQRIQDGQSAAHVAMGAQRFLAQNLTKGIATTENQSEEFQLFMDNLKIGTPKSYENIIGHMSKASRDEHAKFWDSAVEEIVAKIEEFEASPPTGDKNKLLYTGVKDRQQMRIVRAPDGTIGVETKKFGAEEFDFQPLDELGDGGDMEDTLKSLIKQDIDKKFLEMHSAPKEIFEDMTRWMKPFSEPEAISELRGAVDKFSNIFRANVTAPFPGFHVRNFMSATVQNFVYRASDPNELGPNRYFKPIMNALSLRSGEPIQGISGQLKDFVSTKDIDAYKESQIQQLKRQQVREAQASNRELREADFDKINQLEEQIKAIRAAEPDDAMLDIVASRKIADLVFQYGLIGSKQGQAAEVVGDTTSILKSQLPGLNPQNPLRGQWAAAPPDATIFDIANPMAVDGGISLTGKKINADYFILGRIGRSAGGMVEDTVRIAPFIAYLKQGYSPKAAAAMVNKIQIDYSKLSSFERKYARSVFPFWTFSKATLINTVQDLVQNPGGRQANMIRTANVARDEDAVAPEYIQQSASIPLGELSDGSQRYITGFGLGFEDPAKFAKLASGDLGGTAKELLSRTNPLIKYPMELAFGRSTFYDGPNGPQELSELDPTLGRIRSNIYDAATGEKTERPEPFISRGVEHLFANSPFARYGTFARQATDPRKWAAPTGAALDLLTGVKVKDVSEAAQDSIAMQRAGKLFRELGGRNQEIPFFPAEKMETLNPEDRATVEEIKEMMDTVRERRKLRREIEESKISQAK